MEWSEEPRSTRTGLVLIRPKLSAVGVPGGGGGMPGDPVLLFGGRTMDYGQQ